MTLRTHPLCTTEDRTVSNHLSIPVNLLPSYSAEGDHLHS
jgi:hypothetical protein